MQGQKEIRILADSRLPLWVWCAIAALWIKLAIAATTFGTNDVGSYWRFADHIHAFGSVSLYHADPVFNHPPFIARVLTVISWMSDHTPLGFPFWFRLPSIIADVGILWLVNLILRPSSLLMALLALCPMSIMVSGFHGNTDSMMIFFVLLAVYFLACRGWLIPASIAFGFAGSIKLVPIFLGPAFLLYLKTNRQRVIFGALASVTFVVLCSPDLIVDPAVVWRDVFGYRSVSGNWGFTRLARALEIFVFHKKGVVGKIASIQLPVAVLVIVAIMMRLRRGTTTLFERCALTTFLFLWMTPGFGVQYLVWTAPFALAFGEAWTIAVYASSGLFLFCVYDFWSSTFPWYYASIFEAGGWSRKIIPLELAAWLIIGAAVFTYLWKLHRAPADSFEISSVPKTKSGDKAQLEANS